LLIVYLMVLGYHNNSPSSVDVGWNSKLWQRMQRPWVQ